MQFMEQNKITNNVALNHLDWYILHCGLKVRIGYVTNSAGLALGHSKGPGSLELKKRASKIYF
jgi:hypothetical protein